MQDPSHKTDEIKAIFEKANSFMEELMQENGKLRRELGRVEAENQEFAQRYVQIEEHNDVLQNLYVASHRLHATLDPNEVLNTIKEIVINLVGGESFGIWMLDDAESGRMTMLAHEGLDDNATLDAKEQSLSKTVLHSDAWYGAPGEAPLAMVPLRVDDRAVGLIIIRAILGHKKELGHLDQQILGLLSGQAATALTSARLYAEKSRKLETMKAFLDFIKTKS